MSTLRFLADESCDFAVVRALRAAGFDVLGGDLPGGFIVVQPGRTRISHKLS